MEDFVTYEQAQKLKELGFDWEVEHFYGLNETNEPKLCRLPDTLGGQDNHNKYYGSFSAPTLYQAQKWLREKHNIILLVETYFKNFRKGDYSKAEFEYVRVNMNYGASRKGSSDDNKLYQSYEAALSSGIDKVLEFLKLQDNGNQD